MFKQINIIKFLITVALLCTSVSVSYCKKYTCKVSFTAEKLLACGLNVSREDNKIEPVSPEKELSEFQHVSLQGSLNVLTSDICKAFPNLKIFYAWDFIIDEVKEDAFQPCKNVERITLYNNRLKNKLKKNTFKGMKSLVALEVGYNDLGNVDFDLTGEVLEKVILYGLNITVYNPGMLHNQPNVHRLALYSNKLFNIDIDTIVKMHPKLEILDLADNNFKCSRLKEILAITKAKNIDARNFTVFNKVRERNYIPEKINGIHCLSDDQFEKEFTAGMDGLNISKIFTSKYILFIEEVAEVVDEQGNNIHKLSKKLYVLEEIVLRLEIRDIALIDCCQNKVQNYDYEIETVKNHMLGLWIMSALNCFLIIGIICYGIVKVKKLQEQVQQIQEQMTNDAN